MKKHRTASLAIAALLSVSFLTARVDAAEMVGVIMKDGKMMMMEDGKATVPMNHDMTMTDGSMVMADGTMMMKDGTQMRLKEDQMVTMDGKMMDGGMVMDGGKPMKMNWKAR